MDVRIVRNETTNTYAVLVNEHAVYEAPLAQADMDKALAALAQVLGADSIILDTIVSLRTREKHQHWQVLERGFYK